MFTNKWFYAAWVVIALAILSQSWEMYGALSLLAAAVFGFVVAAVGWFLGTKAVEMWKLR